MTKIGSDVLSNRSGKGEIKRKYKRIKKSIVLLLGLRCDVVMYDDEIIPYVRVFNGRKKLSEFTITKIAKTTIQGFLIATGIPAENIPQITAGIYGLTSDLLKYRTDAKLEKKIRMEKVKGIDYV